MPAKRFKPEGLPQHFFQTEIATHDRQQAWGEKIIFLKLTVCPACEFEVFSVQFAVKSCRWSREVFVTFRVGDRPRWLSSESGRGLPIGRRWCIGL